MKKKEKNGDRKERKAEKRRKKRKNGSKGRKKHKEGKEGDSGRKEGAEKNDIKAIGHSNEGNSVQQKEARKEKWYENGQKKYWCPIKKRDCDDAQPRNIYYIYNV